MNYLNLNQLWFLDFEVDISDDIMNTVKEYILI